MLTRVPRLRPQCVVLASFALGAGSSVVRGDLLFFENLDTPARFNTANLMHAQSTGFFREIGGNPGGCADLRPSLQNVASSRAAFESTAASVIFSSTLSEVFVLEADVMFLSGLEGGQLVPVLRQGGIILMPVGPGIPISSTTWTRPGAMAFRLADFRSFEGVAPSPSGLARVGFGVRLTGGPAATPPFAGRYLVDNVSLSVVPGPGAAGVLVVAGIAMARRRRRSRDQRSRAIAR